MYTPAPDGYCGDEDNGQTSAWYVFSALGFYPVCPASNEYVLGAPLFERATVKLENGNEFVIDAAGNSSSTPYMRSLLLDGKEYSRNYITHEALLSGANIKVQMDSLPNLLRGVCDDDVPYSFSKK